MLLAVLSRRFRAAAVVETATRILSRNAGCPVSGRVPKPQTRQVKTSRGFRLCKRNLHKKHRNDAGGW